ncbi:MAG: helix-turn-helix transcriptional regulator [Candidatus Competibacteraceae bacterium]|nr:helix-turn-helix transcriptional regulator [Candidatus Competibacteraceae bacterium]
MTSIGHGITVRRAMLRMSQAKLARSVGVNQSYISLIEIGERPLTDELLQKISGSWMQNGRIDAMGTSRIVRFETATGALGVQTRMFANQCQRHGKMFVVQ